MIRENKVIVVDIDGTLTLGKRDIDSYSTVRVSESLKKRLIQLKLDEYWIILYTSRNMRTHGGNIGAIMKHTAPTLINWLAENEIPYDELHFGKPWCGHNGFYIDEFVEAARLLKQRGVDAECCLLGFLDVQNPAAISRQQMNDWVAEGAVRYLGVSDNVREEIAQADCVVLPSYREGTPRTLLEAAAMARPIVTTDAVGCREVVDDGINGYLCKPKDASDLADKMELIVSLTHAEREAMGLRGREKVEREFDERMVICKYLSAIEEVLATRTR